MAFITGMLLIDAPASALNNSGEPIPGARTNNTSSVKYIRAQDGNYPYVSAQAFRFWVRNTLENSQLEWEMSPVYREEKVAYTDANPIYYWDDDLFGYMRAPSKRNKKEDFPESATLLEDADGKPTTVTRAAPFRVSTLVSLGKVNITNDFGVMARQDGDPAPFEHQFYRATLQGLFSLDLKTAGKFFYKRRSGFQNLDYVRQQQAEAERLEHLPDETAYRLPRSERIKRVQSLLKALGQLHGGAKQSIHYTDVSPAVVIMAVTEGGNHPFNYLFQEKAGVPTFQDEAFQIVLEDMQDQLISPVYVGWKSGYLPQEANKTGVPENFPVQVNYATPRGALEGLATWLEEHAEEWDQ